MELDNKTDIWNAKRLCPTILKIQWTQFKISITNEITKIQHPQSPHTMSMSQNHMHGHELELKYQTEIPNFHDQEQEWQFKKIKINKFDPKNVQ